MYYTDILPPLRSLMRSRAYTLAAILTLAVGLAATAAVLVVANAVVLRPLPYPKPDRLYRLKFLRMFGLQPTRGRDFTADEDSGRLPVAILDGGAWIRRFGGDPNIVGQSIRLDGTPHVVIGIAPQGYRPLLQTVDVYVPLGAKDDASRQFLRNLLTAARLAPNHTESEPAPRSSPFSSRSRRTTRSRTVSSRCTSSISASLFTDRTGRRS